MALKLNERYPGRFDSPTADYPQGSFKNRTAPGALDGSYLEKDWANDKEGFFQSIIAAAAITPDGAVDKVGASQYYDALKAVIADQIDAPRIDVPSAATVNLTTSAPDTRGIRITGTTTITGFTVAAGAQYLVTFAGALTLTNNAAIVTNSGANITTAAGDTCVIRATADNVVEVALYHKATIQSLNIPGYRYYEDGMIEQWGTVPATASGAFVNVVLPITFPNQILDAHLTLGLATGLGFSASAGVELVSTSMIRVYPHTGNGSNSSWRYMVRGR